MALTRDFRFTIVERAQRDPKFARALLDEAIAGFLNGQPETARLVLRSLVNATVGFEALAVLTSKPSKSLQRMLSSRGNPSMDNLAAIIGAVRRKLKVDIEVHSVKAS
ncbi:MAG: transcriptional regulator [Proteobacteria bacterium]|jgi:DNA-binding phage protein|nr:transcriptional regulator [Pseudomonadota bacterium]